MAGAGEGAAARRPELCVGAVAVHDGRLLLIRRGTPPATGQWSLPGGRVEGGELVTEAVVRELREETGIGGTCGELVGWVERPSATGHFVILDFAVEVGDPTGAVAGDDADAVAWVPLGEVLALDLVAGLGQFLRDHGSVPDAT